MVLRLGCVAAAVQMVVFVTVAGWLRPGYDSSRNWISQLSLGPGGWLADVNLALCGLWLLAGAVGLRAAGLTRWTAGLVGWCGGGLIVLAVLPTDAGIGYPPGVPEAHTTVGLAHQLVAVTLGAAGVAAVARLGWAVRRPYAGIVAASVMGATFVAASVLVVLDDAGVWPGNPSGLLERVALFGGLAWIGFVGLTVVPSGSSANAPDRPNGCGKAGAATERVSAANAR